MLGENAITLNDLIDCPGALKVLMALTEVDQTYQFQLTRMIGHHSRTLNTALNLLMKAKLVRIVPGKVRIRNVGDFYALTTHGRIVAKCLLDLQESLKSAPNSKD
jgi:DNA-binding HxlR family transcriptional regulator